MDLKARLFDEMKQAMREKDTIRKDLLQILRSEVLKAEKDRQTTLDDGDILVLIRKEHKARTEMLSELEGVTGEFIERSRREIALLEAYLPRQLTEAEISAIAQTKMEVIGARGPADIGRLMKAVMPEIKGRADGKLVNQVIRRLLG